MTPAVSPKLRFRFSPEKFADVVVFFASRVADLTTLKLVKLIYLADRQHLLTHGRPILGDWYTPMEHGPVPSQAFDLIKLLRGDAPQASLPQVVRNMLERVQVVPDVPHPRFTASSQGTLAHLSPSDLEVLEQTVAQHGAAPIGRLLGIVHAHTAWRETFDVETNAPKQREIDYEQFFSDAGDEAQEMLELARLENENRMALEYFSR